MSHRADWIEAFAFEEELTGFFMAQGAFEVAKRARVTLSAGRVVVEVAVMEIARRRSLFHHFISTFSEASVGSELNAFDAKVYQFDSRNEEHGSPLDQHKTLANATPINPPKTINERKMKSFTKIVQTCVVVCVSTSRKVEIEWLENASDSIELLVKFSETKVNSRSRFFSADDKPLERLPASMLKRTSDFSSPTNF